jgi:hypothetical protein
LLLLFCQMMNTGIVLLQRERCCGAKFWLTLVITGSMSANSDMMSGS